MTDNRDESLIDKVKNAFGMGGDEHDDDHDHDQGDHEHTVGAGAGAVEPVEPVDRPLTDDLPEAEDRAEGWAGVDDALGGAGERSTYGTTEPEDPDRR